MLRLLFERLHITIPKVIYNAPSLSRGPETARGSNSRISYDEIVYDSRTEKERERIFVKSFSDFSHFKSTRGFQSFKSRGLKILSQEYDIFLRDPKLLKSSDYYS